MTSGSTTPIALALSGGGVRAIVFHLGVLKVLAERRLLEHVVRVSTVSGGSLLMGLLLHEGAMRWPSSEVFVDSIYPRLRQRLCERSMQWGAVRQLLRPWNWQFVLSRANLLAAALREEWSITAKLSDIPASPEWSLNGTTAETGKRFRFKRDSMGDYTVGYAPTGDFSLASAIAVSAAFPGGFGPFSLDTRRYTWRKRRAWTDSPDAAVPVVPGHTHLRLYDGGVYDNLGLESIFDAGRGQTKYAGEILVVSDASAPLREGFSALALNPWRFKRLADIIGDQARALRVRTLSDYLQRSTGRGAYIYINTPVTDERVCTSAAFASAFPTTLRRLTLPEFDALSEHGYKVASRVEALYSLVPLRAAADKASATPSEATAYVEWIAEHVGPAPHGQCEEITKRMAATFPELRRVRGHYVCPSEGPQPHWWMVTPDGAVLDPTKEQFASQGQGVYEQHEGPEPTGACLNCGALVYGDARFCNSNCTKEFSSYIEGEVE